MADETKPFWQSKTIWANGIAFVASMLGAFGLDVTPEAQAQILAGVFATMNIVLRFITKGPVK